MAAISIKYIRCVDWSSIVHDDLNDAERNAALLPDGLLRLENESSKIWSRLSLRNGNDPELHYNTSAREVSLPAGAGVGDIQKIVEDERDRLSNRLAAIGYAVANFPGLLAEVKRLAALLDQHGISH